jgi:hypothetical protein
MKSDRSASVASEITTAIWRAAIVAFSAVLIVGLIPHAARACACGCGVFSVGTGALMPTSSGACFFIEHDFMNQNRNWHGSSRAPAANNMDKEIRTRFYTVGGQYLFNRTWGVRVEVPYWDRRFATLDEDTGGTVSFNHAAFSDLRFKGIYSGLSDDMSIGLTFGLKLPTGDHTYANFDADTQIGMGSTDALLGAYYMHNLTGSWDWFANGEVDQPFLSLRGYHPGGDLNAAAGAYYDGWNFGGAKIAPVAQLVFSGHVHDRGSQAAPGDSGYERALVSPGIEADIASLRLYLDVSVPIYQHVRGNQLTAPVLLKVNTSYSF